MTDRSEAPYWRHDAYTLRRLKVALVDCIARIRSRGGWATTTEWWTWDVVICLTDSF